MRNFADDAARYESLSEHSRIRVETIPIERIVGSVGRAHELCSDFLPPSKNRTGNPRDVARYLSIRQALEEDIILPPVKLYKLEGQYYVVDGNHRVAAARATGQVAIDATVTEFRPVNTCSHLPSTAPNRASPCLSRGLVPCT